MSIWNNPIRIVYEGTLALNKMLRGIEDISSQCGNEPKLSLRNNYFATLRLRLSFYVSLVMIKKNQFLNYYYSK